jgi:hypothetical protein
MPRYTQPNQTQINRIRSGWARISRFGALRFVLAVGGALFAWMLICFVAFVDLAGNQRVLRMPFVWEATLPSTALISLMCPIAYYILLRVWIRRIGETA